MILMMRRMRSEGWKNGFMARDQVGRHMETCPASQTCEWGMYWLITSRL